jgi:hypothetical protein
MSQRTLMITALRIANNDTHNILGTLLHRLRMRIGVLGSQGHTTLARVLELQAIWSYQCQQGTRDQQRAAGDASSF